MKRFGFGIFGIIVMMLGVSSVTGYCQWNSSTGQYGQAVTDVRSESGNGANGGNFYGLFQMQGQSEWNGMDDYILSGKYWLDVDHVVPFAVIAEGLIQSLTNAQSLNVTLAVRIEPQDGGSMIDLSVSKQLAVGSEYQTLTVEIPEALINKGTIRNVIVEIHSHSTISGNVMADVRIDEIRLQYDTQGNIIILDSFGDATTGITKEDGVPEAFKLHQNYPNPFNPVTNIQFDVPEATKVKLSIYDIIGNEVEILVDEEKGQGSYTVDYNATHLATGVYLYKLEVSGKVFTKKMMLLK